MRWTIVHLAIGGVLTAVVMGIHAWSSRRPRQESMFASGNSQLVTDASLPAYYAVPTSLLALGLMWFGVALFPGVFDLHFLVNLEFYSYTTLMGVVVGPVLVGGIIYLVLRPFIFAFS